MRGCENRKDKIYQMLRYGTWLWPQQAIKQFLTLQEGKPPAILFAAIGNPVPQYAGTRHNVGVWALDEVVKAREDSPSFLTSPRFRDFSVSEPPDLNCIFLKSTKSYMNLQGKPVLKAWLEFKKAYANYSTALVILHDEIQIPLGKIQVRRQNTSARGHNGLRSIDKAIGPTYTKIGIGVGKPENVPVDKHVLSKFSSDELDILREKSMPQVLRIIEEMLGGKHIYEKL